MLTRVGPKGLPMTTPSICLIINCTIRDKVLVDHSEQDLTVILKENLSKPWEIDRLGNIAF